MRLKFNINYSDGSVKERISNIDRRRLKDVSINQVIARCWLDLCVNYLHVYLENDAVVTSIEYKGE